MKMLKISLMLFMAISLMTSCKKSAKADKAATSEAVKVNTVAAGSTTAAINTSNSIINWAGSKIGGTHSGTIGLSQGNIKIADGKVSGGSFTIDMATMKNVDMPAAEGGDKLVGHLTSADFFDTAKFPTAKFEISKITELKGDEGANSMVFGNLTLKETTKQIGFKANIKIVDGKVRASTKDFTIDRTDFGIKYGSNKFFDDLKDKAINDKITLSLDINAG